MTGRSALQLFGLEPAIDEVVKALSNMSTPLIIVNCSKTKRIPAAHDLRVRHLSAGTAAEVASTWSTRLHRAQPVALASQLYGGRNFAEARKAASAIHASIYIISAGLGVVRGDDPLPSYDLTIALGSPDCILSKIIHPCSAQEWWDICAGGSRFSNGFSAIVEECHRTNPLLLLGFSSSYLLMIQHELLGLPERILSRVRLFSGAVDVVSPLRFVLMPYDARLNGRDSPSRGTLSDFAGRALGDFVQWILPDLPNADSETHRRAVSKRLSSWTSTPRIARKRYGDEQLIALIKEIQPQAGNSANRALRYFRDVLGIACEQERFTHLFALARSQAGRIR